jgi:hypothetical protein
MPAASRISIKNVDSPVVRNADRFDRVRIDGRYDGRPAHVRDRRRDNIARRVLNRPMPRMDRQTQNFRRILLAKLVKALRREPRELAKFSLIIRQLGEDFGPSFRQISIGQTKPACGIGLKGCLYRSLNGCKVSRTATFCAPQGPRVRQFVKRYCLGCYLGRRPGPIRTRDEPCFVGPPDIGTRGEHSLNCLEIKAQDFGSPADSSLLCPTMERFHPIKSQCRRAAARQSAHPGTNIWQTPTNGQPVYDGKLGRDNHGFRIANGLANIGFCMAAAIESLPWMATFRRIIPAEHLIIMGRVC